MRVIIDADACPVKEIILKVAQEYNVPVVMVASIAHQLDYADVAEIISVDNAPQATDMAIVNLICPGDLVVTQDYGLASLVLAKGGAAISPRGMIFTGKNIDNLLYQRYLGSKIRRQGGRQRGPRAHSKDDNVWFEHNLRRLLRELINSN